MLRRCGVVLIAVLAVGVAGCPVDVIYSRAWDVVIEVTEASSGAAVANAVVIYQQSIPEYTPDPLLTEDNAASMFAGTSGITGLSGQVQLTLHSSSMCPPFYCDPLLAPTRTDYVVRVDRGDDTELFNVSIAEGTTVSGNTFNVSVVSVGSVRIE